MKKWTPNNKRVCSDRAQQGADRTHLSCKEIPLQRYGGKLLSLQDAALPVTKNSAFTFYTNKYRNKMESLRRKKLFTLCSTEFEIFSLEWTPKLKITKQVESVPTIPPYLRICSSN